ncbi:hypothetical protein M2360_000938 [Rhizobium sp. SG_E_25_P2]|uniref:hypothetical protein n=1 Tax=Rhizobium sp. SG_E_25_P2 TaxID=2879942 RepID=UPI002476C3D4|nr:hypothetical protein [Rhizobium sp. SG_E_25_P2]MDH6265548.1 hypothetical protein [Rhizobium sp. SG_E_25_P2]
MRFDDRPTTAALLAAIEAERDRRLAGGFDWDFGAQGVHHIATTAADMAGWEIVTRAATALALAGSDATIEIHTETGTAHVTGPQWNAAMLHYRMTIEQPTLLAALKLQAMRPLPQDTANPAHWPA